MSANPLSADLHTPTARADTSTERPARAFVFTWFAFWALLAASEFFGELRNPAPDLWRPLVSEGSSMAVISLILLVWDRRRLIRQDRWLSHPLRWMLHAVAPLPLLAPLFVLTVFGLRIGLYALFGAHYGHPEWSRLMPYEMLRFALFYVPFAGVMFGLRSYRAWHLERLNAERLRGLTASAQLAQLTQQVQPHFLFNALNTISSLMHSDVAQADALLQRLAQLLRAATDVAHRPQQPLAEELVLLRGYVDLMLARFGERAQVQWDVADAALRCAVPTLGLQPLVENAFRHVVERRRATTTITVRAQCAADRLRLEVLDDGGQLNGPPVFGVGLGNLQRRLQVLHGDAARLAIEPRSDGPGVRVTVELPCAC